MDFPANHHVWHMTRSWNCWPSELRLEELRCILFIIFVEIHFMTYYFLKLKVTAIKLSNFLSKVQCCNWLWFEGFLTGECRILLVKFILIRYYVTLWTVSRCVKLFLRGAVLNSLCVSFCVQLVYESLNSLQDTPGSGRLMCISAVKWVNLCLYLHKGDCFSRSIMNGVFVPELAQT